MSKIIITANEQYAEDNILHKNAHDVLTFGTFVALLVDDNNKQ